MKKTCFKCGAEIEATTYVKCKACEVLVVGVRVKCQHCGFEQILEVAAPRVDKPVEKVFENPKSHYIG